MAGSARGNAVPLGLSALLHVLLLLLVVLRFDATTGLRAPDQPEILQAHVVEPLRVDHRKRLPPPVSTESAAAAGPVEEPSGSAAVVDALHPFQAPRPKVEEADPARTLPDTGSRRLSEETRQRALEQARDEPQRWHDAIEHAAAQAAARAEAERAASAEAERLRQVEQEVEAKAARLKAESEAREHEARAQAEAARQAAQSAREKAERAAAAREAKARAAKAAQAKAEEEARAKAAAEKAAADKTVQAKAEVELQKRLEKEAREQAAAEQRRKQREREEALNQLLAQESEAGDEARVQDEAQQWASRKIKPRIKARWLRPPSAVSGMSCRMRVSTDPAGQVTDVAVGACSGDVAFARSAEAAVRKASPLPMPPDARVSDKLRSFQITFQPE